MLHPLLSGVTVFVLRLILKCDNKLKIMHAGKMNALQEGTEWKDKQAGTQDLFGPRLCTRPLDSRAEWKGRPCCFDTNRKKSHLLTKDTG